jgi:hypothetical protein
MSSVELTGKEDLCDVADLIKRKTWRDWQDDERSLIRILDDGCDFALHLGMIEALSSLTLTLDIVDGKPQIKARVCLDDGHLVEAFRVLSTDEISCHEHCEVNITFDDENDAVMTGKVVEWP